MMMKSKMRKTIEKTKKDEQSGENNNKKSTKRDEGKKVRQACVLLCQMPAKLVSWLKIQLGCLVFNSTVIFLLIVAYFPQPLGFIRCWCCLGKVFVPFSFSKFVLNFCRHPPFFVSLFSVWRNSSLQTILINFKDSAHYFFNKVSVSSLATILAQPDEVEFNSHAWYSIFKKFFTQFNHFLNISEPFL